MIRRLAAFLAALGITILLAVPALASPLTNPTPISSDDPNFQGTADECREFNVQPGQVVWHFVINQSSTDDQTVTATFATAGTITVSPYKVIDTFVLHYAITTGSPDTLLSASSSGDGNLQLSHICNGGPPPEIPEAPASAMLVLSSGIAVLGFLTWRQRRSRVAI